MPKAEVILQRSDFVIVDGKSLFGKVAEALKLPERTEQVSFYVDTWHYIMDDHNPKKETDLRQKTPWRNLLSRVLGLKWLRGNKND